MATKDSAKATTDKDALAERLVEQAVARHQIMDHLRTVFENLPRRFLDPTHLTNEQVAAQLCNVPGYDAENACDQEIHAAIIEAQIRLASQPVTVTAVPCRSEYDDSALVDYALIRTGIQHLQWAVHDLMRKKGWYVDGDRNIGEVIALMHSELSEALEEWRKGKPLAEVYQEGTKPEGFAVELADCVIRIVDTCQALKIDLGKAIEIKMAYNATRPYRHGGKLA